jgi:cytochrome c-type biogenesis protein CcmE
MECQPEPQAATATRWQKWKMEIFAACEVLAKHDETYMPKEVADAIAKAKAAGNPQRKMQQ